MEQLRERSRVGRKETIRKPSTDNRRKAWETRLDEGEGSRPKGKLGTEEATVRQNREERGKEETEVK